IRTLLEWTQGSGSAAPLIFLLLFVLVGVLMLPASPLVLGAGAVWGVLRGSVYVSIASIIAAAAAFLAGRHLARDFIEKRIASHPRFRAIDDAVSAEGWRIVLLTRLSPIFPFFLLNYAFSLTRIGFKDYF